MHIIVSGPNENNEFNVMVRRLQDLGIDEHQGRAALSSYNWDINRAIEQLFS